MNTHKQITINDPERWYLKFGEKRKHYIQLHASFWSDTSFLALKNDEKILFLWILSQSLRCNKASLSICLDSAKTFLNTSLDAIKDSLSSLEHNNIIKLETKVRKSSDTQLIEENKRKENKIKANMKFADVQIDLNNIYEAYPKKVGKKQGMEKLKRIVKTQEDYDAVLKGAKNYATWCEREGKEKQFIKAFSSWVNAECWNDELTYSELEVDQAELERLQMSVFGRLVV